MLESSLGCRNLENEDIIRICYLEQGLKFKEVQQVKILLKDLPKLHSPFTSVPSQQSTPLLFSLYDYVLFGVWHQGREGSEARLCLGA